MLLLLARGVGMGASNVDAPAPTDVALAHGIGKRQRVWHPYLSLLILGGFYG